MAALLSDPTQQEDPRTFPKDAIAAGKSGLYSWWADVEAEKLFLRARVLRAGGGSVRQCIYVGQTGATRWPSGATSRGTLEKRIRKNHIGGNLRSSTFRYTISAILRERLNLRLAGSGKLMEEDNQRVSRWIKDHLRVAIVPWEDRDSLGGVEQAVLKKLDPPLNLNGLPATAYRQRLSELRGAIAGEWV